MADIKSNLSSVITQLQDRVGFLMNADKTVIEVIEILRDTHDVLERLADKASSLETTLEKLEANFDVDDLTHRLQRLESAVLNIERGTLKVEAALDSLPHRVRKAMAKHRHQ